MKKHITEKIILVDRAALKPYANNARTHSDEQINQIIASITEFGFTNPLLVDEEYSIIAGHGRLAAATKMGMGKLPCVVVSGLTEAQRKALVLADNKIALNSGWDTALLKLELVSLDMAGFDLKLTGFSVGELTAIFDNPEFAPGFDADQGKLDQLTPKMVQCPNCGQEYDLRKHGQG